MKSQKAEGCCRLSQETIVAVIKHRSGVDSGEIDYSLFSKKFDNLSAKDLEEVISVLEELVSRCRAEVAARNIQNVAIQGLLESLHQEEGEEEEPATKYWGSPERRDKKREPEECPHCLVLGKIYKCNKKVTELRCPQCKLEWEIQEDFNCVICGSGIRGRYLLCSDDECSKKAKGILY